MVKTVTGKGLGWLLDTTELGTIFPPSPIGLYFSKLWHSDELYPIIFSCAAFERAAAVFRALRSGSGI